MSSVRLISPYDFKNSGDIHVEFNGTNGESGCKILYLVNGPRNFHELERVIGAQNISGITIVHDGSEQKAPAEVTLNVSVIFCKLTPQKTLRILSEYLERRDQFN